jgi:hypothetical protein
VQLNADRAPQLKAGVPRYAMLKVLTIAVAR